ncbi:MAG: electron transport complex subunit E [Candidatus Anaerobiospirillum merdipullorum]|uniref:Ion-translocating oxidoreductase complex subunit E n=1 Tax=Candidatus Anaerobiospirillum merdipullorum TaxID=2838450 RepID=A0A9E2NST4_9GAMM|nr:electron transport complex subunit E [Candidatus Anaerobiospirillum merdipullorum]
MADKVVKREPKAQATKGPKVPQPSLISIIVKGLWKENPGLCQLLGMCPLLAVTTSAASALGLGIATILVITLSSLIVSLLRTFILREVRIPIYVLLIATIVTVVCFEVEAYYPKLYQQLGIYLALIVTNCIIMGRAEAFAGRHGPLASTVDALACGIGFTAVLFVLGAVREILGSGTFFVGAADLLGPWAQSLEVHLIDGSHTYLIAILPPGGFFVLALLIALKNALDQRARDRAQKRMRIPSINV